MRKHHKTITERVRDYITDQKKKGKFKPGDKFLSFHKLKAEFGVSYASVQTALDNLEREGIVERFQGLGTFFTGRDPLKVEIYLNLNSFPEEKINGWIQDFIDKENIFVEVQIKDVSSISELQVESAGKKAAIVQCGLLSGLNYGSLLDLSLFKDFNTVSKQLKPVPVINKNVFLPFYLYSHQMGINPKLLKTFELDEEQFKNGFDWWGSYLSQCKKKRIAPVTKRWDVSEPWHFASFFPLFFQLIINEKKSVNAFKSLPIFNTESGKHLLKIISSHKTYTRDDSKYPSFYNKKVPVDFNVGSWITVQYKNQFRLKDHEFKIVPYKFGRKKICYQTLAGLTTCVNGDLTEDEKTRVWDVLKFLVSRDTQLFLAGLSGMISIRNDISNEEHPWNTRKDFASFFPNESDTVLYNNLFSNDVISSLSTLYEQYEFFNANQSDILKMMDEKVKFLYNNTNRL